jgi:hypothetical protein
MQTPRIKNQVAVTFRDNGIKVLRYIPLETVGHLVQHLFFLQKSLQNKNFSTISTRSGHTSSENFKALLSL